MIQFTGNWYIDMGIIGMLKLLHKEFPKDNIETLLQLDDNELSKRFEYAFFRTQLAKRNATNTSKAEKYNAIKDGKKRGKKGEVKTLDPKEKKELENLTRLQDYHNELSKSLNKSKRVLESLDEVRSNDKLRAIIKDKKSKAGRIPLDSNVYKNLWFFNLSKDYEAQKEMIEILFCKDETKLSESTSFDRSINKLLYSAGEMGNAVFANTNISRIARSKVILFSLLSLEHFATFISGTNYFFYSPNLIFTFGVNASINNLVDQSKNKSSDILKITYQSVFDNLYKTQSDWALRNMVLISFKRLDNKGVQDFTTLNIGQLEAVVLNDEELRESLNTSLDQGKKQPKTWIIRDLIERNSLFKKILRATSQDKFMSGKVLRTALSVELGKKQSCSRNYVSVFSIKGLLERNVNSSNVPLLIKSNIKEMSYASKYYYDLLKESENKNLKNEMHYLLRIIQRQQPFKFVNFIMHKLLSGPNNKAEAKTRVTQYLFKNVINKPHWEYYAMGMIFRNFNQTLAE